MPRPRTKTRQSPESDASLALAYRTGSHAAAEILLRRHAGLILSIVKKIRIATHVDRDDLLQVARIAFLHATAAWDPKSPTGSKLTTYASVCVKRAVLRELERRRHTPLPQAVTPEASLDAIPRFEPGDEPTTSWVALPDLSRLMPLLGQLTARQRAAVTARYGLGGKTPCHNWPALARRLRVSEAHARRLHDAALARLRELLGV